MDNKTFAIAIDGPLASGKGTVAKHLARDLNGFYLYTGGMYRAVALYCLEKSFDLADEQAVIGILPAVAITFRDEKIFLNGKDVTERITLPDVAQSASKIAVLPSLRDAMVLKQQQLAKEAMSMGKIVVAEGRDTGTKVFPDAPLKVYLTASEEIRAKRRMEQYEEQGKTMTFEEVIAETRERDHRDTERVTAPLPKDPEALGYFVLDNSNMEQSDTLNALKEELRGRGLID